MNIAAIMPCRNSAWCLGFSARALMMWVDSLVILDHASTDATPDIISDLEHEYPDRISVLRIGTPQWDEMHHRQSLLNRARCLRATHIVTIDDDEVVTGNLVRDMQQLVGELRFPQILRLPWLQMRPDGYITSGMWAQQNVSVAFQDEPRCHWAPGRDGYQHHHREPCGVPILAHVPFRVTDRSAGLMHFQMANDKRLKWKQFWYLLTERSRWPQKSPQSLNAMYGPTARAEGSIAPVPFDEWLAIYDGMGLLRHLHLDADPWQREDALRIMRERPGIEAGLDTFGLVW